MIVVTGLVELESGELEVFLPVLNRVAAETRKEEGCMTYGFFRDIENHDRIRIYEEWESEEAVGRHFVTPHIAELNEAMRGLNLRSLNIVKFEAGEMSKLA